MSRAKATECEISAMLKDALINAGCPEKAILQERMILDKNGNRIYPDIVVADIRTGQPIAVFEIKEDERSEQVAFIDARRAMAHFIDRCPCYVATAINGGVFAVASVFSKDAQFPIWIPLSDKEQFKMLFGDYRDAVIYADKVATAHVKDLKKHSADIGKMVFSISTAIFLLVFLPLECCGIKPSIGFYNLTALLIACIAGTCGLAVHLKLGDIDLTVQPASEDGKTR